MMSDIHRSSARRSRRRSAATACLAVLLASSGLGGCAALQYQIEAQTAAVTGAEPLNTTTPKLGAAPGHTPTSKAELADSITESYQKCEAYKRSLLFGSRASNFGFDVLTTVFSALATAFTPVGTVHALTAAATISSGSKTALDADIYVNATAPLMAQALSMTYDAQMKALQDKLAAAPDAATPNVYFSEVVAVHLKCSLTEAMVTVQSLENQKTPAGAGGAVTVAGIVPKAVFTLNDGGEITITSLASGPAGVTVGYTLKSAAAGATAAPQPTASLQSVLDLLDKNGAKPKTAS